MGGSFDGYQVLYSNGPPADNVRLGQLLIDENEVVPTNMLKVCTALSPPVYSTVSSLVIADILNDNNVWTGTNEFDANVNFDSTVDFDDSVDFSAAVVFSGANTVSLSADSKELRFGAGGDDLAIFHNGTNNVIETNTGSLLLTNTSGTVVTVGQDSTVTIPTGSPVLKVGGAFTGIGSTASTNLGLFINSASTAVEQLRITGGIIRATGTSDATQPAARYGLYTTDFATDRGYWGFPTSLSDLMILRNIAGDEVQIRTSTNSSSLTVKPEGAHIPRGFFLDAAISPAQLVANTDNWAPTGYDTCSVIRVSTDASRNLTGIVPTIDGQYLLLCNVGAQNLVLVHDLTSTAANRFYCPGSANYTLNANDSVAIWYDTTSNRWRVLAAA